MSGNAFDRSQYPPAPPGPVVDEFWGRRVADPYRWLEDESSADTVAFVNEQAALARRHLDALPARARLVERVSRIWDFPKWSTPSHREGRYFFDHNDGLRNQPVLMLQDGLDGDPATLFDPNTLSDDGTVAMVGRFPSPDGRLLGYSLAESGSDWQTLRVLDVASGKDLPDVVRWAKFTPMAWLPDGSGFYYARYPEPGTMPDAPPSTHHRVYLHRLGDPQAADRLVYRRPDDPDLAFDPHVTVDGALLVLHVWRGTDSRNRLYYRPIQDEDEDEDEDFVRLFDDHDAAWHFVHHLDGIFLVFTNHEAPRGKLVRVSLDDGVPRTVVPEGDDTMQGATVVGGELFVLWLRDARHVVTRHDLDGTRLGDVDLPGFGSVSAVGGRAVDDELFVGYESFTEPPQVLRYHVPSGELSVFAAPDVPFDPTGYVTEQHFVAAGDGVELPLFVTRRVGNTTPGPAPTVLYGYGGFNIPMTPAFSAGRLAFLEEGGVFAQAVLRGGGEYGESWHEAGMLHEKQRVFDDFLACADHLVALGITTPSRLGIFGGSNGGLLTTAAMLQAPGRFGAVVAAVPVTDMLRYLHFTAGRYWIPEYGDPAADPEMFETLLAYSPLHNVDPAGEYPPLLITTAEGDDRVVPMHSYKLAATLQAVESNRSPVLLRIDLKAGHGLGKPTAKLIDEAADVYAFFLHHLETG